MQEQDHLNEGGQFAGEISRNRETYSFQEVVYPPPLWKRVAFILLRLVIGGIFGVLVMWLTLKVAPEQSSTMYMVLLIASMPGVIYPKTRALSFGLLLVLVVIPIVFFLIWAYIPLPWHMHL